MTVQYLKNILFNTEKKISKFFRENLSLMVNASLIGFFLIVVISTITPYVSLNSKILMATFWALCVYTWKTWQLKDLTAEQITLDIRPFVTGDIATHGSYIKNLGNGVTINIESEEIALNQPILVNPQDPRSAKVNYIKITCNKKSLIVGEEGVPSVRLLDEKRKLITNQQRLIKEAFKKAGIVKLYYTNLKKRKYWTTYKYDNENLIASEFD